MIGTGCMKTFADFRIEIGEGRGVEVNCQCPQCSPSRKKKNAKPLSANTEKGLWFCNHCGWAGTLAVGEQVKAAVPVKDTYRKPHYVNDEAKRADALYAWFATRGIPREVVQANQITLGQAYMPTEEGFVECVQFPYVKEGEVVNVKYRGFAEKIFRQHAGAEKILYGMGGVQSAACPSDRLVIVEGEMDALSVQAAGIPCVVSVPDGAPAPTTKRYAAKFDYLENCQDFLAGFKTIVVAVDADEPGKRLAEELVRRLGPDRCYTVQWPDGCKDANDVLVRDGATELASVIDSAKPVPLEGVYEVADLAEEVMDLWNQQQRPGFSTGWPSLDPLVRIEPGELIVLTGVPSHGKSEWLDALMVNMAEQHGWSFGVFSPENFPVSNHVAKLSEKYTGQSFSGYDRMTQRELLLAMEWVHQHFYFLANGEDALKLESILERAKGMVTRYGIRGFVIDPWNEIDHSECVEREDQYLSKCLSKIRRFGRKYGVAMFVVAHPQKMLRDRDGGYPVPTMYDINGGAMWRNKADMGLVIWRDVLDAERKTIVYAQKVKKRQNGKPGNATLHWTPIGGRYSEQPWKTHRSQDQESTQRRAGRGKQTLASFTYSDGRGSAGGLGEDLTAGSVG